MTAKEIIKRLKAEAVAYSAQARIAKRIKVANGLNKKAEAFDMAARFVERIVNNNE